MYPVYVSWYLFSCPHYLKPALFVGVIEVSALSLCAQCPWPQRSNSGVQHCLISEPLFCSLVLTVLYLQLLFRATVSSFTLLPWVRIF